MAMLSEVEDLTRVDYERIRRLVYAKSGIDLGDQKMQLVRSRLGKRVRERGFKSYHEYLGYVEQDPAGEELCRLLDAITTNTTHLFREIQHFKFLKSTLQRWLADKTWRSSRSTIRIWSAGCSSGEEPHSTAMVVHDVFQEYPNVEVKILATDLSVQMLGKAKLGLYEPHRVGTVPGVFRHRYLRTVQYNGEQLLQLVPELRQTITFSRFNLMAPTFPFKNRFDVIFCRNVMIYFDRPTQQTLANKFAEHLCPGGYLFIGHSETLNGLQHPLSYVMPATYMRKESS